jgi:hypothetical protein
LNAYLIIANSNIDAYLLGDAEVLVSSRESLPTPVKSATAV